MHSRWKVTLAQYLALEAPAETALADGVAQAYRFLAAYSNPLLKQFPIGDFEEQNLRGISYFSTGAFFGLLQDDNGVKTLGTSRQDNGFLEQSVVLECLKKTPLLVIILVCLYLSIKRDRASQRCYFYS